MKQVKPFYEALLCTAFCLLSISCQNSSGIEQDAPAISAFETNLSSRSTEVLPFLKGADLSYTNELEDCGVQFKENGEVKDPYTLMNSYGANLVRLRLWHNPTSTTQVISNSWSN